MKVIHECQQTIFVGSCEHAKTFRDSVCCDRRKRFSVNERTAIAGAKLESVRLALDLSAQRASAASGRLQGFSHSKQSGWSRPSYTDSSGRYAHYGVRPDKYLLHIRDNQNKVVWQQDVSVNGGQTQVPQIVLPRG